jgi:hypothetical protein
MSKEIQKSIIGGLIQAWAIRLEAIFSMNVGSAVRLCHPDQLIAFIVSAETS